MNATAEIQVWAPTAIEYLAARATLGRSRVRYAGIGLRRLRSRSATAPVIICGLAGGLIEDMVPGTIFIPSLVTNPDGSERVCDPSLTVSLTAAAATLGFETRTGSLFTTDHIVTGLESAELAKRGFAATDMESGLAPAGDFTFAVLRVILDTPANPISRIWERPARVATTPSAWKELGWLGINGPKLSLRAARIVREALASLSSSETE